MDDLKTELEARLHSLAGPFLFVGAGLSRRYADLPSWEGLLRHFAAVVPEEFEAYRARAEMDLPLTATNIAADFFPLWWKDESYAESRALYQATVRNVGSPLKVEVARYVREFVDASVVPSDLQDEWELLRNATVDGLITTNYDSVLETLFPDYEVFVGQDALLFSDPQGIAEIYKIHGSAEDPESLVLTQDDYKDFHKRNPYLAAKLLTIFVERPVIFLGYSLTDRNVQEILQSLVDGLHEKNVDKLQQRLIFVEWERGATSSLSDTVLPFGDLRLPITRVVVPDFRDVFTALGKRRRAIPAKVLRLLKEQVYDVVLTNDPAERLVAFTDIDSDSAKDVEIVFGVGAKFATQGIRGLQRTDLWSDVLEVSGRPLPAQAILDAFYDGVQPGRWMPIFKYLDEAGHLDASGNLKPDANIKPDVRVRADKAAARIAESVEDVIPAPEKQSMAAWRNEVSDKQVLYTSFKIPAYTLDVAGLREFIIHAIGEMALTSPQQSYLSRTVLVYDYMRWGPGRQG